MSERGGRRERNLQSVQQFAGHILIRFYSAAVVYPPQPTVGKENCLHKYLFECVDSVSV